jgi:hypothetical protein
VGDVRGEQPEKLFGLVERGMEIAPDLLALLLRIVAQEKWGAAGAHALQRLGRSLVQHLVQLLDFST